MTRISAALLGAMLLAGATAALAQSDMTGMDGEHAGHGAAGESAAGGAAAEAYRAANAKMHADMTVALSGDADADFLRSMIPHHQGAIDMAEIQLKHGRDPEVKRLAGEIIAAQRREIAEMKAKLAALEKADAAPK